MSLGVRIGLTALETEFAQLRAEHAAMRKQLDELLPLVADTSEQVGALSWEAARVQRVLEMRAGYDASPFMTAGPTLRAEFVFGAEPRVEFHDTEPAPPLTESEGESE